MKTHSIVQAGHVVNDIDTSMAEWITFANIGPFHVMRHVRPDNVIYRGSPAALELSLAFAQAGPLQIELIQVHSSGPNAYREVYPDVGEGFHHLCYFVDDFDAEMARFQSLNIAVACQASSGNDTPQRFAYLDTWSHTRSMTEVIEDSPFTRDLYKTVADASVNWDGSDPIRELG